MESLTELSCAQLRGDSRAAHRPLRLWRRCSSARSRGAAAAQLLRIDEDSALAAAHRRQGDRARLRARPAARRADGAQGHVLPARRGFDLRLEDPARHARQRHGEGARASRRRRRDPVRRSQHGGVRHGADRPQLALRPLPQSLGSRAHPAARRRARAPQWPRAAFAALGSDTGGSVRLPVAFCGIAGMRPTHGRVSVENILPLCPSLDTVGPLTRTVEDAAWSAGHSASGFDARA